MADAVKIIDLSTFVNHVWSIDMLRLHSFVAEFCGS